MDIDDYKANMTTEINSSILAFQYKSFARILALFHRVENSFSGISSAVYVRNLRKENLNDSRFLRSRTTHSWIDARCENYL